MDEPDRDARRDARAPGALQRAEGWTRADFLKAAGAGAVGVAVVGGGGYWLLAVDDDEESSRPTPAVAPARVRRFVSRPDLRPAGVTVLRRATGTDDGLLFLSPSSGPGQRGALILDDAGDVVWFRPSTPDTTMDFRAAVYKGEPVLTWWEGRHQRGVGLQGDYVVADASYREIARFRSRDEMRPDFHEVLLTSDDTALVLSYEPVAANLSRVGGPRNGRAYDGVVKELEIPSGRVLFEWRSLEHVAIEESYQSEVGNPYDYFHVNSAGLDADGHLLVSARNTWAVYKVDRGSGRVIWRLGGRRSDFAMGPRTRFAFQHDARTHEDGRILSLFDNGPLPNTTPQSRALFLELDTEGMRATLAREITHRPPLFARVTGGTQVLPNGNVLVTWGSTGVFTEYDEEDEVRFDARLPAGGQNYRVYRFPWTGRPSEPPALAARAPRDGAPGLYASWNGATEVASWRLRSGSAPGELADGPVVPRSGFETELAIPEGASYVAADALDADGEPLRTSNVVRL